MSVSTCNDGGSDNNNGVRDSIVNPPSDNDINNIINHGDDRIGQYGGNDSIDSASVVSSAETNSCSTLYDSDEEPEPQVQPFIPFPVVKNIRVRKQIVRAEYLTLISVTNAHSLYNKSENFKTLLKELTIECSIVSETWERK